jgi:uncharacterized protein
MTGSLDLIHDPRSSHSKATTMSLSMHAVSIPLLVQILDALSGVLDKGKAHAEARKIDQTVLLGLRLAPDMLPLNRQVHLATDFAKNIAARLAGVEAPKYDDTEATFDELKARIAKTKAYIESFEPAKFDGSEMREITLTMRGEQVKMTGQRYYLHFALPNFFFHATTAYDILRNAGVEVGKRDFMGKFI